jgi:hypothetical protein
MSWPGSARLPEPTGPSPLPLAAAVALLLSLSHAASTSTTPVISALPTYHTRATPARQPASPPAPSAALNHASAAAASSCPRSAAFIALDRSDDASQANSTPCCVCRR